MGSCVLCHTVGNIPLLRFVDTSILRALYIFFCGIFDHKQVTLKYKYPRGYYKIYHHIIFMWFISFILHHNIIVVGFPLYCFFYLCTLLLFLFSVLFIIIINQYIWNYIYLWCYWCEILFCIFWVLDKRLQVIKRNPMKN